MGNRKLTWGLLGGLLLALLATGAQAAKRPDDTTIDQWVREALQNDPRIDAALVAVKTTDGSVKLTGEVESLAARQYADLETKKIAGVKGVIDELLVRGTGRDDSAIASDIRARLDDSPLKALRDLDVRVVDGEVHLGGQVDSWSERREARLLASEVLGVRKVTDDLTIHYATKRSDADIRKDVDAALRRDVALEGLPISASVKDGDVTLTGTVGSAYEKDRAVDAAWVENVQRVDDKLKVEWWENEGVRKQFPVPDDETVRSTVELDLTDDLRIADPYDIDVEARYGHVTLSGTVPTFHEKRLATQDAKDVVGVGWVTNDLSVNTDRRNAADIRDDIRERFDTDYMLSGQDLQVEVADGVATLMGDTVTANERDHAVDVASRVPGVLGVVDHITVDRGTAYTDATLEKHVRDRLRDHDATRWIADSIQVRVTDGVVTLSGEVPFWSERREAGRLAFLTDGVRGVDNGLRIQGADYPWGDWHYPPSENHDDDYYFEPLHPLS